MLKRNRENEEKNNDEEEEEMDKKKKKENLFVIKKNKDFTIDSDLKSTFDIDSDSWNFKKKRNKKNDQWWI